MGTLQNTTIFYTVGFRQLEMALFDWTFSFRLDSSGPSSSRQSSRFNSFCAFPRGGRCEGVLVYGTPKSVGSSVLRAFFASNACFTRDEPWLVALGLVESRQSYVGGVALSREPPKLQQAQPLLAKWHR